MAVSNGRDFLATPGPTVVPDVVLRAMHRPAVDLHSEELVALTDTLLRDLRAVFRTAGRTYIYAANGHGAWQAALSNILSRGDSILVLESGLFPTRWGDGAAMLGLDVEILPGSWTRAVEPDALEARLRADRKGEVKAVLMAQVDTASGVVNDVPAVRAALDAAGHPALLVVDAIASLATIPFEMDDWGVDVAVAAAQKGLMMAPGLSMTAAGERAQTAHRTADLCTQYWDWSARDGGEHYMKYCGTAPEHMLFGLRAALDMLLEEGLPAVFRRHALLAEAVRRAVACWADGGVLSFNIEAPEQRANSVTTVRLDNEHGLADLRDYCDRECRIGLGLGIGGLSGKAFRIAHMGHVNAPMILGVLGGLEMALTALDIPHGRGGMRAAIDWLAESVPPA